MKATDSRTSRSSKAHPFATVELFGLCFIDAEDESVVAEHLATADHRAIPDNQLPIVFTPNVDIVVQLEHDGLQGIGAQLTDAAYILPDGAPLVWTSRWAGTPLQARLAGSTVFERWWPRIASDRRRVVVFCSSEEVKTGLEAECPSASVVVAPMIDTSNEQIGDLAKQLVAEAIAIGAEFCVVCIGHPKDPMLALAALEEWPDDRPRPLMLCLGASAELYLGIRKRAPEWAQQNGLEWFVRFVQEPRRMFHRYFVRDLAFLPIAAREVVARRRS